MALPKIEIKDTKKYGKGSFAGEDIAKGEVIKTLTGEIISLSECKRRVAAGEESIDDPLQIDEEIFLDVDELSKTFNHSCDPNAGLRKTSELFALRDIKRGEEITFDYSTTVGPNITASMWAMVCHCNSENCRKEIGNILTLPPKTLEKYRNSGALQDYIIRLLDQPEVNERRKSVKE